MDLQTIGLLAAGLSCLALGAEMLVRGAVALATLAGISPLVIGLTVVAFGTSSPEFAVSVGAGISGQAHLAVGNVIGSNLFNTLAVLGIVALLSPLAVSGQLVRVDVPVMAAASGLAWIFCADGLVNRWEGIALVLFLALYCTLLVRAVRHARAELPVDSAHGAQPRARSTWPRALGALVLVGVGLTALSFGARWLVTASSSIARTLGVAEVTIGLTVVAVGTSLPELATSLVAGLRGHPGLAVGNVVGSNIFNLLAVLGGTAVISGRVAVPLRALRVDLPLLFVLGLVCVPMFITGRRIGRTEGGLLVMGYGLYLGLLLAGTGA